MGVFIGVYYSLLVGVGRSLGGFGYYFLFDSGGRRLGVMFLGVEIMFVNMISFSRWDF